MKCICDCGCSKDNDRENEQCDDLRQQLENFDLDEFE